MRILRQKARQFGEDRSLERAEVTLFLHELEYQTDKALSIIDIVETVEGATDKEKKIVIACEVKEALDHAKSLSIEGKMALPLQFRRVIDKWNKLMSVSEEIFTGEERL